MNRPRRAVAKEVGFYKEEEQSSDEDSHESTSEDSDDSEDMVVGDVIQQFKERPRCPLDRAQMNEDSGAKTSSKYDRNRGSDEWVGHRIKRSFTGFGYFIGVVVEVKPWGRKKRLFRCVYDPKHRRQSQIRGIFENVWPDNNGPLPWRLTAAQRRLLDMRMKNVVWPHYMERLCYSGKLDVIKYQYIFSIHVLLSSLHISTLHVTRRSFGVE